MESFEKAKIHVVSIANISSIHHTCARRGSQSPVSLVPLLRPASTKSLVSLFLTNIASTLYTKSQDSSSHARAIKRTNVQILAGEAICTLLAANIALSITPTSSASAKKIPVSWIPDKQLTGQIWERNFRKGKVRNNSRTQQYWTVLTKARWCRWFRS